MLEKIPLYTRSIVEAQTLGELELWRQSHEENIRCARAILQSIDEHYDGGYLDQAAVQPVIEEFGYDRVFWVTANTIQRAIWDGRFSHDNREWARKMPIPPAKQNVDFIVDGRSGLLNLFLNEAKQRYNRSLGLFDRTHCEDGEQDYEHRVLVVKPNRLEEQYMNAEYQLYYAVGGFGCKPGNTGKKVLGEFLKDGDRLNLYREDFIGVLKDEFLPEWAAEKLEQFRPQEGQQDGPSM